MSALDECVSYLKNNAGFVRLIDGLFDMYVRYERCFGAVRVINPSEEEEQAISDFFKRDYFDQALIRIGLAEFERQAQRMFSSDLSLSAILEAYTRRPLSMRRTDSRATASAFAVYLENEIFPRYVGTDAENWVTDLSQYMRRSYKTWTDSFVANPKSVKGPLEAICEALNGLPFFSGKLERLSDFSARFMADPHAYDYNGKYGTYFMRALAKTLEVPVPLNAEEYSALCYNAGLLSDGVLNRVTLRGLDAFNGQAEDEVCAEYNKRREPHVLTLENMSGFTSVKAKDDRVYIIENLSVFSAVNEQTRNSARTVLCSEGVMNAALVCLLNMLAQNGTKEFYYSGGMDYRGLALADKLYLKYPRRFVPWRYSKEDYDRVVTDADFFMPENKKDAGLHNEDLASLLSYIRKRGKAVSQTALIKDLVKDLL